MALHVQYTRNTFRPVNDLITDNETADNPVEFDLAPAEGEDLARLKSVVIGSAGLVSNDLAWTSEIQNAISAAFVHGAMAFVNTVEAVRGLTVPAALALRKGLITDLPQTVRQGATRATPDHDAPVPITTGAQYARIAGFLPAMSLHVASEIVKLSGKLEVDPRFFGLPSGSGGAGTPADPAGTAGRARRTPRRRGTAGAK